MQELNWNDICIIGDSFAYWRTEYTDWPKHLVHLLTNEPDDILNKPKIPRGKGFPGCSWWSVRRHLLEQLESSPIKILIICHTELSRIPSKHNFGLNLKSLENGRMWVDRVNGEKQPVNENDIIQAALQYYNHLAFYDYENWSYIQWLKELNEIIQNYYIKKVIHLPLFHHNNRIEIDYIKQGVITWPPLSNWYNSKPVEYERNHLSKERNMKLAHELYRIINSDKNSGVVDINLN